MRYSIFLVLIVALLLVSACRDKRYFVNINDIELDLSITKLEKVLFENNPDILDEELIALLPEHSEFLRIFGYVINIGDIDDDDWINNMISFATDRQNVEAYKSVRTVFQDQTFSDSEMLNAWKHYKYYFPDNPVPGVYTCLTGFNNSIIVGNNVIGISLDRYLGFANRYYPMLGIYEYLRKNMIPEKIVSDCMFGWASSSWELPEEEERSNNLLENMLHEGKLLYFTRLMVPEQPDSLLFGHSGQQMQFCENNEKQMWEYLVEHDLLFSTDPMLIKKFTGEAPFTTYFTNESPGKAASWIGFRIVESYMLKNPEVTLSDLMNEKDLSRILELSRYSP